MMGYMTGSNLTNPHGGLESILFASDNTVTLSGDGKHTVERSLPRATFETCIDEQTYLVKQVQRPHIVLTEIQQSTISSRLLYLQILKTLVEAGACATTQATYDTLIEHVERAHPATIATKHPARKTICRHWRTWALSNFNDESLACKKRHCATRLKPASEALLQHSVGIVYSSNNSCHKKAFYNDYCQAVNKERKNNSEIELASKRTYYRRLKTITDEEKYANYEGLSEAEKNKRLITCAGRIKTHYAMQRVECDRVKLNMCLIDDKTGTPTAPISLYVALDAYTRCPVSVVLSFEAESAEGGLNLLRNLFIADNNLPMHGRKPTALIMDNGPGFNNNLMKKAAERLGVDIHYTPSNQPAKKPFIESFFNKLRNEFFSGMKIETLEGEYTIGFQSYSSKRGNKNTIDTIPLAKRANVKVSDFIRLLNTYFTEYMHKHHASAGHTPIEAWKQSINNTPAPFFTYSQLQACFHVSLQKTSHTLYASGNVRCLGQDFYSHELKALYKLMKTDMANGESPTVDVLYDTYDLRKVTVITTLPGQNTPVEYVAYNIDHIETETPVSFYDVKGLPSTHSGIYLPDFVHTPTGEYIGCIESFFKQKPPRTKTRGPRAGSFNRNTQEALTVLQRINKSNNLTKGVTTTQQPTTDEPIVSKATTLTPTQFNDDNGEPKLWGNDD